MRIGFYVLASLGSLALIVLRNCALLYGLYVLPVFLEHSGANCLADGRKTGSHADYIRPLRWVKWKYTVVCGIDPPVQDHGNQDFHTSLVSHRLGVKPIPPPGQWQHSHAVAHNRIFWNVRMDYLAIRLKNGLHARLGWRWDDVDGFYVFSLSIKKIPDNGERCLGTNFLSARHM